MFGLLGRAQQGKASKSIYQDLPQIMGAKFNFTLLGLCAIIDEGRESFTTAPQRSREPSGPAPLEPDGGSICGHTAMGRWEAIGRKFGPTPISTQMSLKPSGLGGAGSHNRWEYDFQ